MKALFKSENMKSILFVLALIVGVKAVWFVATLIFLPSQTQELQSKSDVKPLYYRVVLAKQEGEKINTQPVEPITQPATPISALSLIGIYVSHDIVIATVQKGPKTHILSKGQNVDEFVLIDATRDEAFFEKEGKRYALKFTSKKPLTHSSITTASLPKEENKEAVDVIDRGSVKVVKRDMLEGYMKQPNDIWKDIGISEIKSGKEIVGFMVRFVRRDSGFEKLGLERGDVILAINGERLNSYQDAFDAYKNIQTMQGLTVTIKRKNQEMELDYEIK